jgi:6-phosphogluconolactonase/glucosamine-6-phosphate isomerase/deaminase
MEDLLVDQEQWIVVEPSTISSSMSKDNWEKLDNKYQSTIQLCLADSVLLNVSGGDTTKKLWDKLGNLYQSKSMLKKFPYEELISSEDERW